LLLDPVRGAPIVKARRAEHAKAEFTAHCLDTAYQVMGLLHLFHRHEVRDLCHSLRRQEARQEDIRIREIQLFLTCVRELGRNLKPPAFGVVQEGSENSRRVKVWKGKKVD